MTRICCNIKAVMGRIGISVILLIAILSGTATAQQSLTNYGVINSIVWQYDNKAVYFSNDAQLCRKTIDVNGAPAVLAFHENNVTCIAATPDQSVIASVGWDGILQIRAGETTIKKNIFRFTGCVAIDPKGQSVAIGDCEGKIRLFDIHGNERWMKNISKRCINSVAFDVNSEYLISGGDDGDVRLFDIGANSEKLSKKIDGKGITVVKVVPTNKEILVSGKSGKVARLSFPELDMIGEYNDHDKTVVALDITSDGRFLFSGDGQGRIVIRDLVNNCVSGEIKSTSGVRITALAVSPDGKQLCWGSADQRLNFNDLYEVPGYAAVNSAPCQLVSTVQYHDENTLFPTNAINGAEEGGYLEIVTANRGEGPAFGVKVQITCSSQYIQLAKSSELIGYMPSGKIVTTVWPIAASVDLDNGTTRFTIGTIESEKRDAPVVILPIQTVALERPEFRLSGTEWNDGLSGLAHGNNNKIPENGETVELSMFIENAGTGRGKNVQAVVNFKPVAGLVVLDSAANLGNLEPGHILAAQFLFRLERDFSGAGIEYSLDVTDQRQLPGLHISNIEKEVILNTPVLTLDLNRPGLVSNGQSFRISMVPRNLGIMEATGVKLNARLSPELTVSGHFFDIGIIEPNKSGSEQVMNINIPRDCSLQEILIELSMVQDLGFPGFDTTISIPLKQLRPQLEIETVLLSEGHSIRQGSQESAQIIIRNNGELEALNTSLLLSVNNQNVSLSETKIEIGRIPAGSSTEPFIININVPGGVPAGQIKLILNLVQDNYATVESEYAVAITERDAIFVEKPTLIDVPPTPGGITGGITGGNDGSKSNITLLTMPPMRDTLIHSDKFIFRSFTLFSPVGIASVEITVNGVNRFDQSDGRAQYSLKSTNYQNIMVSDVELPLKEGSNKIIIQARESITNKITVEEFEVQYIPASSKLVWRDDRGREFYSDVDVDIEKVSQTDSRSNRCAVIIGIEEYTEAFKSKYSRHDAEVFARYSRDILGVPENNIFAFYDTRASFYNLTQLFDETSPLSAFLRKYGNEAEIYFYYSGHGVPNYTAANDADTSSSFILPFDVAPTHSESQKGGLSVNRILHRLKAYSPRLLFAAFDACFMGQGRDGKMLADQRPARIEQPLVLSQSGEVSLYATGTKETAIPYTDKYHGLFTYFLLRGLRGDADREGNRDNQVSFGELRSFLLKYVPEYASKYNSEQKPLISESNDDLILVKLKK